MTAPRAPRLVVTAGIHGSASTWVFNVVRELMIAALGEDKVASFFAEKIDWLDRPEVRGRHVVMKSHAGADAGWSTLVWLARAPVLVSVRDPRDAALSMRERFGVALPEILPAMMADCRLAMRAAQAGHLVMRYEDGFFDDPAVPPRIARHLGLGLGEDVCRMVFERYRTEAVRQFAASIAELGTDRRVGSPGERLMLDRVTQIHHVHIGDGAVGKWRTALSAPEKSSLAAAFEPYLRHFGYDPS